MKRKELIVVALMLGLTLLWSAPPHPQSFWQEDGSFGGSSEIFSGNTDSRFCGLPDSILVLRCEFSDVSFDLAAEYPPGKPDAIPHDEAYFERFLFHLATYWQDASHGLYDITSDNFTMLPDVYQLSEPMSYYGDDELSPERVSEMLVELLDMADADVNFSAYDSFIIFHAGAGQEADLSGNNTADLWTTFVNRRTLQTGLDPENDEFPGLEYDGTILKEFIIAPETERQPDIQSSDPIFGLLGVLCHEFGRQMGLPTLYDNQSSNGKSAGIGNYGVMGTGLWNAAGNVPPLPCAWSRIYLGWESQNLVVIEDAYEDLELLSPMLQDGETPTIYKVMISTDEYFLLENRTQNTDNSTFVNENGDTLATFSFEELPEQDCYPDSHAYAGQPRFIFMENTYAGCEWDFYLPGYGEGDALTQNGSGICIWHVDEQVMRAKFNIEEEINIPNGEEEHKAVDLEEADGNQGLDTYGYYGNRDDTYRAGNNDYFGYLEHDGMVTIPTAESYYGGIQLEIYNISTADTLMSFSVGYGWSLDGGYTNSNTLPAAFLDFGDGVNKLFYPMPDGNQYLWENNELIANNKIPVDTLSQCWSWEPENKVIYLPGQTENVAYLYKLDGEFNYIRPYFIDLSWGCPVLITKASEQEAGRIILGFNSLIGDSCKIQVEDLDLNDVASYSFPGYRISNNMMYNGNLFIPVSGNDGFSIIMLDIVTGEYSTHDYVMPSGLYPTNALLMQYGKNTNEKIILTTSDSLLVQLDVDLSGTEPEIVLEKEINLPFIANSYPSVADMDGNGYDEILLGGENSFLTLNVQGVISTPLKELSSPDSANVMGGVVAIDNGSELVVAGMMSRNRLCIWENEANNNFVMKKYYPVSFVSRSLLYPILADGVLYIPSNNGKIYRDQNSIFPQQDLAVIYADLQRTGYHKYNDNGYQNLPHGIFIDEETYVYPNPYSTIYDGAICNGTTNAGKVAIHVMLSSAETLEIKIYDIAGNLVISDEMDLAAYFAESYLVDAQKLASGVYFAKLKADTKQKLLKFGIEK